MSFADPSLEQPFALVTLGKVRDRITHHLGSITRRCSQRPHVWLKDPAAHPFDSDSLSESHSYDSDPTLAKTE